MNHAHVAELPADMMKPLRLAVGSGRKAVGMAFNIKFGARMPTKAEQHKRAVIWRRGMVKQGLRFDQWLERQHRMQIAYGHTEHASIDIRIEEDSKFRKKLGMKVVTCRSNYAPAQVLLSRYCRMAFERCIREGEFSYENIGRKALHDEDVADE
jgi:hypothetical protein